MTGRPDRVNDRSHPGMRVPRSIVRTEATRRRPLRRRSRCTGARTMPASRW
jgi:hypothetical protein